MLVPPSPFIGRKSLVIQHVKAGFTGEKKDKRGHRICYRDGKRVGCNKPDDAAKISGAVKPVAKVKPAGAKPTAPKVNAKEEKAKTARIAKDEKEKKARNAMDLATKTARDIAKNPEGATAEEVKRIGDALLTMSKKELVEFKKELNVKGGTTKASIVEKIKKDALTKAGLPPDATTLPSDTTTDQVTPSAGQQPTETTPVVGTVSALAANASPAEHYAHARSQLSPEDQKELDIYAKVSGLMPEELHNNVKTKEQAQEMVLGLSRVVADGGMPAPKGSRFNKFEPKPSPQKDYPISSGWSPSMSSEDAKNWAKDSKIQSPIMHVTTKDGAKGISQNGFDLSRKMFGRVWGNGVYATDDKDTEKIYQSQIAKGNSHTLQMYAKVSNPFQVELDNKGNFHDEMAQKLPGGKDNYLRRVAQEKGRQEKIREDANKLYPTDANKQMQHCIDHGADQLPRTVAMQQILEETGHDALVIKESKGASKHLGGNQVVVFNPKNVVTVKDDK